MLTGGVPSLHILGRADPYLAQSRYLVESYVPCEGRRVLEHEGGQILGTSWPQAKQKTLHPQVPACNTP